MSSYDHRGVDDRRGARCRRGGLRGDARPGYKEVVTPDRTRTIDPGVLSSLSLQRIDVRGVESLSAKSAAFGRADSRCGIYVLHFDDGSEYVGQTRDVFTRFCTHVRTWKYPIVSVDFAAVPPDRLDDVERRLIQHRERAGARLRNSALVGLPQGASTLDVTLGRPAQEAWLNGVGPASDLSERVAIAVGRPRDGTGYLELREQPYYSALLDLLAGYVRQVIPAPAETEQRFRYITAMPSTGRTKEWRRVCALTVNNVETLVIGETTEPEAVYVEGFLNVAPEFKLPPDLDVTQNEYRTVGSVQNIWSDLASFGAVVKEPLVRDAARTCVMGLMRKGTSMMGRYHSLSLADDVFQRMGR